MFSTPHMDPWIPWRLFFWVFILLNLLNESMTFVEWGHDQYSICGKTRWGSAMYFDIFWLNQWGSMKTWGLRGSRGYPQPPTNRALGMTFVEWGHDIRRMRAWPFIVVSICMHLNVNMTCTVHRDRFSAHFSYISEVFRLSDLADSCLLILCHRASNNLFHH